MERIAGSRSSIEPTSARAVALGRVVGAHGLRGGLRVRYFAEGPENLLAVSRVALGQSEADPDPETFDVRSVAAGRAGELRLELVGVRTREEALALGGRLVLVSPGELRPLGPGEYYGYQLLGCRVESEDGVVLGTLREIWETGASDVLVVEDGLGRRHLLPAALLRRLDAEDRRIVMEILPGLLAAE
jgi:16S rRNA processing protein RimM